MSLEQRALGQQGLVVAALGLGCMGMSQPYGPADETESIATIHRAIELGCTLTLLLDSQRLLIMRPTMIAPGAVALARMSGAALG